MQSLYARCVCWCVYLAVATLAWAQAPALRGRVSDPSGSSVPGADVRARLNGGREVRAQTNENGEFQLVNLSPGTYSVRVLSKGFAIFEMQGLDVKGPMKFDAQLVLATEAQVLQVEEEINKVSTSSESNVGALVLKDEDLKVLSDDPDQLANELQALAGPGAGPNGGQIFIDGFTGGRLPPKSAIREIRVNQNPYSAEYDRIGFGRIEILTKPGADKFRGELGFNFGDGIFNSRNPFATNKAPFQSRMVSGRVSGPVTKKSSFSFDIERRDVDENAVIRGTQLDASLLPTPFGQSIVTPNQRTGINPRFDLALNDRNTLVARYSFSDIGNQNQGIGQFSLPSRAYNSADREHTLQLTETAVLSSRAINETRFQYQRSHIQQTIPTSSQGLVAVDVLDSFSNGGPTIGNSYNTNNGIETSNITSLTMGAHSIKVGGRVRFSSLNDYSQSNFNGTFTFFGGRGPVLDASNLPTGATTDLTSLERYRRTLLFASLPPAQIRALGGGASQYSLSKGTGLAALDQMDVGIFVTDDWRVRPNLTLGVGLRYENQTNISSNNNFAPRFSVAWGVDGGKTKAAKTVLRIGSGLFYDRVAQNLSLQQLRYNGVTQVTYLIQNPDFFGRPITDADLGTNVNKQTFRYLASDIRTPYLLQTSVGIDRQLPKNTSVAVNYIFSRGIHNLRAVNLNAPINGVEPLPGRGFQYYYESNGFSRQNQIMANFNTRFNRSVFMFGMYMFGHNRADTDSSGSFPANTYDLTQEYGRSGFDIRHRFISGGSLTAKYGFSLSPFIIASTGGPFNITTGSDNNGDGQFNDRPSFAATGATGLGIRSTPWGTFNLNPRPGETLIPRNYGQAPGAFTINLRLGKTFGFGSKSEAALVAQAVGWEVAAVCAAVAAP